MAHSVCPYDGFAPAPILTNRLLLRARRSGDFLPSRPFEFQATHATSLRTRANSRHVARSSSEGSRLADLLPASLPSAPRTVYKGTRDHPPMRRLRHNPSLIVVERHRSRLSRGGSPGARERAPRRGGGGRALGPPPDGLALILANKTARARAPVALARARSVGSIRPFAHFSSPAAVFVKRRRALSSTAGPASKKIFSAPHRSWGLLFRTVLPSFLPQKAPPPPVSVLRRRACTGAGARGFRSGSP